MPAKTNRVPKLEEVKSLVDRDRPTGDPLSRADAFAMCAPDEIPEWFKHDEPGGKPKPPDQNHLDSADRIRLDSYDEEDLTPADVINDTAIDPERAKRIATALADRRIFNTMYEAWTLANQQRRYFAWRRFYAERMLEVMQDE